MGSKLFGTDIAAIVAKEIAPGLLDATLWIRPEQGQRDPNNLTAGRQRDPVAVHGAKGIWEDYRPSEIGDLIRGEDRRAMLIGDTIPEGKLPKEGDDIEIDGQRLTVVRLESADPAKATYRFQCGDRRGRDGQ